MKRIILIIFLLASVMQAQKGGSSLLLEMSKKKASAFRYNLQIPDTIYCFGDTDENIFYENISLGDLSLYNPQSQGVITADSSFTFTSAHREIYPCSITVGKTTRNFVINATEGDTLVTQKSLLFMGDSKVANLMQPLRLYGGDSLLFVGTQVLSVYNHEGYGGKTFRWFASDTSSPFVYDSVCNFGQYMSSNGFTDLDFVIIRLSTNDVFSSTDANIGGNITSMMMYADTLINSILAYSSDIKIALILDTPPSEESLFYATYSFPRTQFNKNMTAVRDSFIVKWGLNGSDKRANVSLLPLYTNCDINNDFVNGVHENSTGHFKEAKTLIAWIHSKSYREVLDNPYVDGAIDGWHKNATTSTYEYTSSYMNMSGLAHIVTMTASGGLVQSPLSLKKGKYNVRARIVVVSNTSTFGVRVYSPTLGYLINQSIWGTGEFEISMDFSISQDISDGYFWVINNGNDSLEYYLDYASIEMGSASNPTH